MSQRPATSPRGDEATRILDSGFWLVVAMSVVLAVVMLGSALVGALTPGAQRTSQGGAAAVASAAASALVYPTARPAPAIELTDQDGRPFSLASLRGAPVLVFFGYTHCPDVCPATVGTVGLAMDAYGPDVRAVYVTVDPERDTTEWLAEYVRYLPAGFVAVTGKPADIRATADAWGVRYARVETGVAGEYSMSHTADVYLVDPSGLLRAHFPFGTSSETMAATLRTDAGPVTVAAPTPAAPPVATPPTATVGQTQRPAPVDAIDVEITSSSVWAGGATPLILSLSSDGAPIDDVTLHPDVRLIASDGSHVGGPVAAIPVRPPGLTAVSYVATLDVPAAGTWRIEVAVPRDGGSAIGSAAMSVLDQGATARLGATAPTIRTLTLADVGGIARTITTDPAPDLRLSERSTADALAAHEPFVLIVDSSRFRTTQACGRAIVLARNLLDRWQNVPFIHLEPFRYSVIADTPVLDGTGWPPALTDQAAAWGIGPAPWSAVSMPWIFVVDGDGIVRAKYRDVIGTGDIDVMLALIAAGG
jgi:protein SCO1